MPRAAGPLSATIASQLSLFDAPAPAPQPAPPRHPAPPVKAGTAPAPLPTPSPALTPAEFRHPQADREIRLNGHLVAYTLRRARRRSIGFVVGTEGLAVNAPRWVGIGDIETALRDKAGWILRKLGEQRERAGRVQAAKVDWRDGTSLPYLGETVIVVLDPRSRGAVLHPLSGLPGGAHGAAQGTVRGGLPGADHGMPDAEPSEPVQAPLHGLPHRLLHVGLPHTATPAQIRDTVQSWLQREARRIFEDRCAHYAQQLGVRYTRIGLSSAQTRWGSASASGAIRLNWRLIHFGLATIDYVVAHELAHLREMNHSPRFWDVVRSVMPDYEQAMGRLKTDVLPVFD
jgi:predicted metal-dependent hydrolase